VAATQSLFGRSGVVAATQGDCGAASTSRPAFPAETAYSVLGERRMASSQVGRLPSPPMLTFATLAPISPA
jgi:hypothetical protein